MKLEDQVLNLLLLPLHMRAIPISSKAFQHLFFLLACSLLVASVACSLPFCQYAPSTFFYILLLCPQYHRYSVMPLGFCSLTSLTWSILLPFLKVSFQLLESYSYPSAWEPRSHTRGYPAGIAT